MMDFFQHRYYRTSKTLLTIIGQWPYQSVRTSRIILAIIILLNVTQLVPEVMAAVKHYVDQDLFLESLVAIMYSAVCAIRLTTLIWKKEKMLMLLNRIRADWLLWADDREVNIVHEYAEHGRKFTIAYTGLNRDPQVIRAHVEWKNLLITPMMCSFPFPNILPKYFSSNLLGRGRVRGVASVPFRKTNSEFGSSCNDCLTLHTVTIYSIIVVYMIQPIVPTIIDIVLNNSSEPGQFPIPVYYYRLDEQKYYFYILIYDCICICSALTVIITYDTIFIVYVLHGCGIFAAVGHKLEKIGKDETSARKKTTCGEKLRDQNRDFEHLVFTCIARHNDAIEYAKLIESTFSWTSLISVTFRVAILCTVTLQIVTRIDEFQEIARFIGSAVGIIAYVYMDSYIAQALMDHSISIRYYIQNSQWYTLSLKTQKLLQLMTMRCNMPCQLTAGKIITLSIESFMVFLKTSMSYITVLRSM